MDVSLLGRPTTSDPYVRIKVGSQSWSSEPIMKTCNPVWTDAAVHFFEIYSKEQWVQIDVFDWDLVGTDDHLGSVNRCPVKHLIGCVCSGPVALHLEASALGEAPPPPDARLYIKTDWLTLVHPLLGPEVHDCCQKYVVTHKIVEITGLPESDLGAPFTVQFSVKGDEEKVRTTSPGYAQPGPQLSVNVLQRVKKLASAGVETRVIAQVLDISEDLLAHFLAEEGMRQWDRQTSDAARTDEEKRMTKWIKKIEERSKLIGEITRPQFEEVLMLPLSAKKVTVVVELLNDKNKRPPSGVSLRRISSNFRTAQPAAASCSEDGVVARLEVQLGDKETLHGPFEMQSHDGQHPGITLHGCMTLWRLESLANPPNKKQTVPVTSQRKPVGCFGGFRRRR